MSNYFYLSEAQLNRIKPYFPKAHGVPRVDDRRVAKRRLAQLAEQVFYFHLKECEFRFNNRKENLYAILLKELRKKPL